MSSAASGGATSTPSAAATGYSSGGYVPSAAASGGASYQPSTAAAPAKNPEYIPSAAASAQVVAPPNTATHTLPSFPPSCHLWRYNISSRELQ